LHSLFCIRYGSSPDAVLAAPDLGGARSPGPGPPTKGGPPTMFICLAICATCAYTYSRCFYRGKCFCKRDR